MENQANSKSIILNYGLYFGIASVFYNLILYALNMHLDPGAIGFIGGMAIIATFITLGIQNFKKANNSFLTWGQAVKVGIGIAVVGGVISIIYQYVFANYIEPDFISQSMELSRQKLFDAGLTEEQIEAQLELAKKLQGPFISAALGILISAFFGFIVSAIAGAIMKKSEEEEY